MPRNMKHASIGAKALVLTKLLHPLVRVCQNWPNTWSKEHVGEGEGGVLEVVGYHKNKIVCQCPIPAYELTWSEFPSETFYGAKVKMKIIKEGGPDGFFNFMDKNEVVAPSEAEEAPRVSEVTVQCCSQESNQLESSDLPV